MGYNCISRWGKGPYREEKEMEDMGMTNEQYKDMLRRDQEDMERIKRLMSRDDYEGALEEVELSLKRIAKSLED